MKPPRNWHGFSGINWRPFKGSWGNRYYIAMVGGFWYRAEMLHPWACCGKTWRIEAIENEGVFYV